MSDLPLPETKKSQITLTFTRPNIVISNSDGVVTVKGGESMQVTREVEESFGFEVVDEKPFRIMAISRVSIGNVLIECLDEHSVPTAESYIAMTGHRILIGFRCVEEKGLSEQHGKPVYRTYRQWIILP